MTRSSARHFLGEGEVDRADQIEFGHCDLLDHVMLSTAVIRELTRLSRVSSQLVRGFNPICVGSCPIESVRSVCFCRANSSGSSANV